MRIVVLTSVKMKLSHKDFILIIGIAVALIIAITAALYQEVDEKESKQSSPAPKTSLNQGAAAAVSKLLHHVGSKL